MKNLTIIALSIVFITLSVFFAACQKEKNQTINSKSAEYTPYGFAYSGKDVPNFILEIYNENLNSVMKGTDFNEIMNWDYSNQNEELTFNANVTVDWNTFPASDIISKSANQIVFREKSKNDNIIVDNIVAENGSIRFELRTMNNKESVKVNLKYADVDFSTFIDYELTDIEAGGDSKVLVIPLIKVMRLLYGAVCLGSSALSYYYCNKKINEEIAECNAKGWKVNGVNSCGISCIEPPKNN